MDIVKVPFEIRKKLTESAIKRMEKAHAEWWEESHSDNDRAYAKAKDKVFGLCMSSLPELLDCYRKSPRFNE